MLDVKKIEAAINMITAEKKIPREKLIEIIEAAIRVAYRKDYGNKDENVNVKLNLEDSKIEISVEKTIVEEVTNPYTEISLSDLGEDGENLEIGDVIEEYVTDNIMSDDDISESFGRIASQAARQVIIQKIGETEKEKIYELFNGKEGEILNMKIDMIENGKVILNYNGNQVVLPKSEQVNTDNYSAGSNLYVYVAEVSSGEKGPRVILSRKHVNLVPALFSFYVPEVADGSITIEKAVRKPGVKTKILVSSSFNEIDPAGTMIGQKGMRVKSVMEEVNGEKIDVIPLSDNIEEVIGKSLTPARVSKVIYDEETKQADVYITSDERAKAVGRNGVNVNLASELTGYNISIKELENIPINDIDESKDNDNDE